MVKENEKVRVGMFKIIRILGYTSIILLVIIALNYFPAFNKNSFRKKYNKSDMLEKNELCEEPCHGPLTLKHTEFNSQGQLMLAAEVLNLRDAKKHHFDLDVSEKIPLDRSLPDARSEACKSAQKDYPASKYLPNTSVIFSFCNEPLTTLWRSVISVLNRTPPELLHEIILVDDGSTSDFLRSNLDDFVNSHPKIKLIRLPKQVGLMGGRQAGADIATGDTLTFLDSHIEVTMGWFEPLAFSLLNNPKQILFPVIDTVKFDTFDFSFNANTAPHIVGFRWDMFMTWIFPEVTPSDPSLPIDSPAMPGGLFTVVREWWIQIGGYDTGMTIWGGENMELGFRSWLCGGSMAVHRCCHIGHVFQDGHGYDIPGEGLQKNQLRVAKIWMDDYAQLTYGIIGKDIATADVGNIDRMLEYKKKNQCKPFQYFLDNVFGTGYRWDLVKAGGMSNLKFERNPKCFDIKGFNEDVQVQKDLIMYTCHGTSVQFLMLNTRGELVHQGKQDSCLDFSEGSGLVFHICHNMGGNQEWHWDRSLKRLKHKVTGKCLAATAEKPLMEECNGDLSQQWSFAIEYKDQDITLASIAEIRKKTSKK